MFECLCCGKLFAATTINSEPRGEAYGFPTRERTRSCPRCGGVYSHIENLDRPGKGAAK